MPTYRALISVPIEAPTDTVAEDQAYAFATILTHPGSVTVAGHVELLTEVNAPRMTPVRIVMEDHGFREQLPSQELPEIG